jgi:putative peptidoglycan lipid II flippase
MKQTETITAAALMLAVGNLLSRVLGYVREMLLAWKFGASETTDAFYAAFQIPDLLNYFLAGGALSIAFIPLYNKALAQKGEDAAAQLAATVLGTLGLIALAATMILGGQADALVRLQFPKFSPEAHDLTVQLTRIVLPGQIFFMTGGIVQAVLLARRSFRAAMIAPIVYNICIIAGGCFLYPVFGIFGFAYGTLAGAVLGPFLVPVLFSYGHVPLRARFAPFDKGFLVYLALAAPLMFGQTLLTLDEWYGRWFGGLLGAGTVAHLSYARRLIQVPIAVIGQALAAAALPTLSKLWAEGRTDDMNKALQNTLDTGLALAGIAAAGAFVLAQPAVDLVYFQGAFTADDAMEVATLLSLFALAVPAWIVQQIAVRGFYARGDTWRPMALGTVLSIAVIPLYLWLSDKMQARGIALAGVLGMTLSALGTIIYARLQHGAPALGGMMKTMARSTLLAMVCGIAAHMSVWIRISFMPLDGVDVKLRSFIDLACGGLALGVAGGIVTLLVGSESHRGFLLRIAGKK